MAFEMKDMTGSLFVNDRKQAPNHPDFTGKIMIAGTTYRISAWKKQSKAGKHFLSLSIREIEDEESDRSSKANPFE